MSSPKTFSEYLNASSFTMTLLTSVQPIYVSHMRIVSQGGMEGSFDSYEIEKEKYLKSIMSAFGTLQTYFEDLEKVVVLSESR